MLSESEVGKYRVCKNCYVPWYRLGDRTLPLVYVCVFVCVCVCVCVCTLYLCVHCAIAPFGAQLQHYIISCLDSSPQNPDAMEHCVNGTGMWGTE